MDLSVFSDTGTVLQLETDHMIITSQTAPEGSVRALNSSGGILWRINGETKPVLGTQFDPCSVSASNVDIIFIADRGTRYFDSFFQCLEKKKNVMIGKTTFLFLDITQIF